MQAVATRYKGQLGAIEIQNEPDLTCSWQPGLPFEEGVETYVRMLKAGWEGAKAGDLNVKVAGIARQTSSISTPGTRTRARATSAPASTPSGPWRTT